MTAQDHPQEAAHYFIIPFWREPGAKAHVVVTGTSAPAQVRCELMRNNGQKASETAISVGAGQRAEVPLDLFEIESGAVHVLVEGGAVHAAVRIGEREIAFADVDALAGVDFVVDSAVAGATHAVIANAGTSEVFVFVNDQQGPFIPPSGAAAIPMPEAGPLHLMVESGDGVLSYAGAAVHRRK